ncbi:hypothetical protein RRG08_006268 [Elysia crispata]|uniref:Uncharacterized protein n=1 Tax=Elysia crispata TaxID=231223 RepID=A0AAE0YRH1_9GAST|nr:hypothetical protein RRG08_006268 [Elysia crispata]
MEMGQGVGFAGRSSKSMSSVFSSSSSSLGSAALPSSRHPSSVTSPPCLKWQATVPTLCERSKVVVRRSEGLALLPITWDIAVTIYQELVRLIHRLPFHKRLVVCLVYRGVKFRLDLGEGHPPWPQRNMSQLAPPIISLWRSFFCSHF